MAKLLFYTVLILISILFYACANIGYPSGGVKDTSPPEIIKESPVNQSIHFADEEIFIEFNEFIQLKNINDELVINPPVENKPEITNLGKRIRIQINNQLDSNTTYQFDFNKAIVDNNEGNILHDYRYVFSTGGHIDSLSLSGSMHLAFDRSAPETALAILHNDLSDSALLNKKPTYIAKTDEKGFFDFANLPGGKYRLYGLHDMNANMLYDQPGIEGIAFLDSIISLAPGDSVTCTDDSLHKHPGPNYTLALFKEDTPPEKQYVKEAERLSYEQVQIIFNRSQEQMPAFALASFQQEDFWVAAFPQLDSFDLWLLDSQAIQQQEIDLYLSYAVEDSNSVWTKATDTLTLLAPFKKNKQTIQTGLSISHNLKSPFPFFSTPQIETSHPIETINDSCIIWEEKADTSMQLIHIKTKHPLANERYTRKISFVHKWNEGQSYRCTLYPGALIDVYGQTIDTTTINFNVATHDLYGSLSMNISTNTHSVIVQLLDKNEKKKKETYSNHAEFSHITPGVYSIKLILDEDVNEKWTTGNLLKKIQPEKVHYYPIPIDIKGGWDIQESWSVEEKTSTRP